MKRHSIIAFTAFVAFAALLLTACGKSDRGMPERSGDFLIPESAALIGYIDVSSLMQHNQIKTIKVTAEKQLGIKLDQINELSFWVSYDGLEGSTAAWAIAGKAKAITDISAAFEASDTIDGVATYTLKNEEGFRAAIISDYAVVGTDAGIAMSIQASKGANLPQSPRDQLFRQMMSKTHGALTIAFVPTPAIKDKMNDQDMDDELASLLENCDGIGIAADYKDEKLFFSMAIDSSEEAVRTAAAEIMNLKENTIKPLIAQYGSVIMSSEDLPLLKKAFTSFMAKATDKTLLISLEIPGKLLETLANLANDFKN